MASRKELTFEEKLNALENIVAELESGNQPLEESLEKFKKGIVLSQELQEKIQETNSTVIKIINDDNNQLSDFDIDAAIADDTEE